ncbi:MAG TPA: hypothetical protein VKH35_17570 [Thermoanaerobaculia bacterium]|jgi:hypothetical protein|nr:hypothetical protein [Thermoanaerobaculia bacterium]
MNIESELKALLQRREPPPGFADRVLARLEARHRRILPRALAAAALVLVILGGWGVGETLHARNELRLAMRITAAKVAQAQQQVRSVSR